MRPAAKTRMEAPARLWRPHHASSAIESAARNASHNACAVDQGGLPREVAGCRERRVGFRTVLPGPRLDRVAEISPCAGHIRRESSPFARSSEASCVAWADLWSVSPGPCGPSLTNESTGPEGATGQGDLLLLCSLLDGLLGGRLLRSRLLGGRGGLRLGGLLHNFLRGLLGGGLLCSFLGRCFLGSHIAS